MSDLGLRRARREGDDAAWRHAGQEAVDWHGYGIRVRLSGEPLFVAANSLSRASVSLRLVEEKGSTAAVRTVGASRLVSAGLRGCDGGGYALGVLSTSLRDQVSRVAHYCIMCSSRDELEPRRRTHDENPHRLDESLFVGLESLVHKRWLRGGGPASSQKPGAYASASSWSRGRERVFLKQLEPSRGGYTKAVSCVDPNENANSISRSRSRSRSKQIRGPIRNADGLCNRRSAMVKLQGQNRPGVAWRSRLGWKSVSRLVVVYVLFTCVPCVPYYVRCCAVSCCFVLLC